MILKKVHVQARGELQSERYFGFKLPLVVPTIVCLREVISQGHLKEGIIRKGDSAQTQRFPKREGKVTGTIRPTPGSQKGLRLITE
jgi:hypothetical protein